MPRISPKTSRKVASEKVRSRPVDRRRRAGQVDEPALGQHDRHQAHRDVDEEHRLASRTRSVSEAADQRAGRERQPRSIAPQIAERARPLGERELLGQQRYEVREHHGAADALDPRETSSETADHANPHERRGRGEDDQADEEDPLAATMSDSVPAVSRNAARISA